MKGCFSSCRSLLSIVFCFLLCLFIIVGMPLMALSFVFTGPENVKNTLKEVNLYENVHEIVLNVSSGSEALDYVSKIGGSEEELATTLKRIVSPEWLQENLEDIIDSTYIWLDGGSKIPEFSIDLSEIKTNIADESSNYLIGDIDDLPVCTESDMQDIESGNWSPYDMKCKPSDFDISTYQEEIKIKINEELDRNELLKNDELNSSEMIKLDENLVRKIQQGYMVFKKLPVIVAASIFGTTLLIFLFMPGLSNKLLASGIVWVLSSALLLFGAYYTNSNFNSVFEKQINKIDVPQDSSLIGLVRELIQSLLDDGQSHIRQYSLAIIVVGFILLIGGIILKFSRKRYYVRDDSDENDKGSSTREVKGEKTDSPKNDYPEVKLK